MPENEADSPWAPFHTTRGFESHEDVATVVGGHGPITVPDSGNVPAEQILTAFASAACAVGTNLWFQRLGQLLLLMSPDHAAIVASGGYSRSDVQQYVIDHARQPIGVLRRSGSYSEGQWPSTYRDLSPDDTISLGESGEDVLVAVVGGPSPYSHVVPTMAPAAGPRQSRSGTVHRRSMTGGDVMTVAVYTPDGLPTRLEVAGALRPPTHGELRISTLDNGKVPGALLLAETRRCLVAEGSLEGVTVVRHSPGQGLDAGRMTELTLASDAVINALAD